MAWRGACQRGFRPPSTANKPNHADAEANGRPAGSAQGRLRGTGSRLQDPHRQLGGDRPKETLDDQDESKPDEEIVHCGAVTEDLLSLPCELLKYLKKSESGEIRSRVSSDFKPFS